MDFTKFDALIDKDEMEKDIKEAKENEYTEVPGGEYECKIEKIEIGETKEKHEPMFKVMLRITEGKFAKQCLFFNRKIYGNKKSERWNDGKAIQTVIGWLENLQCDIDLYFESYSQFNDLICDIAEDVVGTVGVTVAYDPDAFNPISIEDVYDLE